MSDEKGYEESAEVVDYDETNGDISQELNNHDNQPGDNRHESYDHRGALLVDGIYPCVLFVSRFGRGTTKEDVQEFMSKFGPTTAVTVRDNIAFVDFANAEDAKKAKEACHYNAGLNSDSLIVDFKKDRDSNPHFKGRRNFRANDFPPRRGPIDVQPTRHRSRSRERVPYDNNNHSRDYRGGGGGGGGGGYDNYPPRESFRGGYSSHPINPPYNAPPIAMHNDRDVMTPRGRMPPRDSYNPIVESRPMYDDHRDRRRDYEQVPFDSYDKVHRNIREPPVYDSRPVGGVPHVIYDDRNAYGGDFIRRDSRDTRDAGPRNQIAIPRNTYDRMAPSAGGFSRFSDIDSRSGIPQRGGERGNWNQGPAAPVDRYQSSEGFYQNDRFQKGGKPKF